jgi:hypothetical protein
MQAAYQQTFVEGLAQKAHSSGAHRADPELLVWESGNENDGDAAAIGDEPALQVKAGETRHLQIGPIDSLTKSSSSTIEIIGLAKFTIPIG